MEMKPLHNRQRMSANILALLVGMVAMILPLAGCGSEKEPISSAPAALSVSEQDNSAQIIELTAVVKKIPYFGDFSKCKMASDQANAYAQLITKGIQNEQWGTKKIINEYDGAKEVARNYAYLCDFAGDGNPYLVTFDDVYLLQAFTIYGYANGQVSELKDCDSMLARESFTFYNENNLELLEDLGSMGAGAGEQNVYSFSNGGVQLYGSYIWNGDANGIQIDTIDQNGQKASNYYTGPEAYGVSLGQTMENKSQFNYIVAASCSITEMADILTQYANLLEAGIGISDLPADTFKSAINEGTFKNKAFLSVLDGNDAITYAALADMDGDSEDELVIGISKDSYSLACMIYDWADGKLSKKDVNIYGIADEVNLWKDTTGKCFIESFGATDSDVYYISDEDQTTIYYGPECEDEQDVPESERSVIVNDSEKITVAERDQRLSKFSKVETISGYDYNSYTKIDTLKTVQRVRNALQ